MKILGMTVESRMYDNGSTKNIFANRIDNTSLAKVAAVVNHALTNQ